MDADTIFPNGSTGKAFTSAGLAILVDQGRIGWDDKVIDHMPWFRMYDPWVTREITVRDLLVHRSGLGLGAGDLLAAPALRIEAVPIVNQGRFLEQMLADFAADEGVTLAITARHGDQVVAAARASHAYYGRSS